MENNGAEPHTEEASPAVPEQPADVREQHRMWRTDMLELRVSELENAQIIGMVQDAIALMCIFLIVRRVVKLEGINGTT